MAKITFENRAGVELTGTLELPAGGEWLATALFAHCFTCGRNVRAAREITRALAAEGFAVLRFDFTGLGESEGEFADTTFSSNLDDLEDAAAWLGAAYAPPQLLAGHSLGGTAVIAVAERLPSVRAVATLGAPASASHVLHHFDESLAEIERTGSAAVELGGDSFRIRQDFVEDARTHPLEERLRGLRRALLVMHSPVDDTVSIDEASRIFAGAMHPKSFVSLDGADHLLSDADDARYAGDVIAAWAHRFLKLRVAEPSATVEVAGRTEDGFVSRIQTGRHTQFADEPKSVGGKDVGPDPYAYLAASLGACTVMTLNMYARHKGLAVERVVCDVSHARVHEADCEDCENDKERYMDELTRTISIEGDIDAGARERMLEIAERCPVHKTLAHRVSIKSRLA